MNVFSRQYWQWSIQRDTDNPPYQFRIETPLFLFSISKWGCTYLAFIRGGQHGGYLINFTWYRKTFAVLFIVGLIFWQHPNWKLFDKEIQLWRKKRDVLLWGIQ